MYVQTNERTYGHLTAYNIYRLGHFGDVLPSQSLGIVLKKLNPTQHRQTTQEQNSLKILT